MQKSVPSPALAGMPALPTVSGSSHELHALGPVGFRSERGLTVCLAGIFSERPTPPRLSSCPHRPSWRCAWTKLPSTLVVILACMVTMLVGAPHADASERRLAFGVITQRSAVLTARYWNPILQYLSRHSGVPLELKLARHGTDHARMIRSGDFAFIFSNHNFAPANDIAGYTVFARTLEPEIQGQIVVLHDSPIQSLAELQEQHVVFPSKIAFVGYYVPQDALLRSGILVRPMFAGTQESAFAQLAAGRAVAAAVNSEVVKDYAARRNIRFRVLWSSAKYLNMAVSAHPSVPHEQVKAVREAMIAMADDPEGARILADSARLIGQRPPFGFVAANDDDYAPVRQFYRQSLVKEDLQ